MKKDQNSKIKVNPLLLLVSFFLLVGLGLRMAQLSLFNTIDGVNLHKLASSRTTKKEILPANRGTIYDIKGNALAENVLSYTVIAYLDPKRSENQNKLLHVVDKKETAKKLAPIINMDASYIEELLNRKGIKQVELGPGGRGITELTKEKIEALELPGIDFMESYKRYYPNGQFASYIVGYAKNDNNEIIGELGLESYYNKELRGKDGYLEFQRDKNGYQIPNTKEIRIEPVDGKDIYLTIDNNIQLFVERAVSDSFKIYKPDWMVMVVADGKTGKILASSSYPSFDPNIRNVTNYLDPMVSYAFEPGSTMKTYTYMAAMENNKYNGNDTFKSGKIAVGDDIVNDWEPKGWGMLTYDQGFALSSNVGATNLVQKYLNGLSLKNYLLDLGFGKQTGIKLPKEVAGKIAFKYPIEIATASFGQGITTTPIQHIQALTAISNNGILLKPYIIDKIVDPSTDEVLYHGAKEELGRVASTTTVSKIKELMANVINNDPATGTGYMYKVEGLDMIGKTGTAQIADSRGGYLTGDYNTIRSFAGMYPKEDPQVIIYAVAKRPLWGTSKLLTDAVKAVAEDTSMYLNIFKSDDKKEAIINYELPSFINKDLDDTKTTLANYKIPTTVLGDGTKIIRQYPAPGIHVSSKDRVFIVTNGGNMRMPNIIGWPSREVLTLINLLNIDYEFDGYGFVYKQSISIDTLLKHDDKLTVYLKPKFNLE